MSAIQYLDRFCVVHYYCSIMKRLLYLLAIIPLMFSCCVEHQEQTPCAETDYYRSGQFKSIVDSLVASAESTAEGHSNWLGDPDSIFIKVYFMDNQVAFEYAEMWAMEHEPHYHGFIHYDNVYLFISTAMRDDSSYAKFVNPEYLVTNDSIFADYQDRQGNYDPIAVVYSFDNDGNLTYLEDSQSWTLRYHSDIQP